MVLELYSMATVAVQESSCSTYRCTKHVFLSFGEDTRKTFTDHLYTALVQAGFHTFRDYRKTEKGEKFESELQQSRISIVVFSKEYATSKWCLDELVTILGQYKKSSSRHVILPVFYDVDPSQLRKQTGSIGEAFARYEEEKGWMDKVKGWRQALKEVADLAGMVLQNQADGYESKFIEKVVKVIADKLSRTVLNVDSYIIGIHSRAERINYWLQDGSGVMVIYGMGGIGKTTIAKFVYSLNFKRFEASSFLANVREISKQPNGLVRLQRQLLSDILKRRKEKIYNVDEGFIKIKDSICCKRILLVLDDVDQVEQLDAILGMRDWLHPGSKIIITTRHEFLLKPHEAHKVHQVEQMNYHESLKLFTWHAFGQDHPIDSYVKYVKRVVDKCGGLPLALQVLGSSLSGKSQAVWEDMLEKLEVIPHSKIIKQLKISYDSLQDDHDKNLFLHIACFFVGKDRDNVIRILNECDFYTTVGIQNLIDRCLVTVEHNRLVMHQLLQDMGREIVRQESPGEPGKRSRLWRYKDSLDVLRGKTGTETVEGIILNVHMLKEDKSERSTFSVDVTKKRCFEESLQNSSYQSNSRKRRFLGFFTWRPVNTTLKNSNEVYLETDTFARMHNLRLLQLSQLQLTGSYKEFPKRLRWLYWRGFSLRSMPSDLLSESLVVLDIRYSSLEQVWLGTKVLGLLKSINLSHSHSLTRVPDFSMLPNLEILILKDCVSLVEINESIGKLEGLTFMNLRDCKNLGKLPRNIGMLKSLERLIISGCSNLDWSPTELKKMESLKVLQAEGLDLCKVLSARDQPWHAFIWSLVSNPTKNPKISWASLPGNLRSLSLADCNLTDDAFCIDFSNLSLLQNLDLSRNLICSLPASIRGLTWLHTLDVQSCTRLKSLIKLPRMTELHVNHCTSLERISYQSPYGVRSFGHSIDCHELVEVQDWFRLEPIGNVDAKILNNLGLNLESMENAVVKLDCQMSEKKKRLPPQGLHEHGVFSTFLPGDKVPDWFSNKSMSSSITFIVPSLVNLRIEALNICCVYKHWKNKKFSVKDYVLARCTKVKNRTKNMKWIHNPVFSGIPEANESMIWLSLWKFGDLLAGGDEMKVSVHAGFGLRVKEVGVHFVCFHEQEEKSERTQQSNCEFASLQSLPLLNAVPQLRKQGRSVHRIY